MKKIHSILLLVVLLAGLVPAHFESVSAQTEGVTVELQPGESNVWDVMMLSDTPTAGESYGPLGVGETNATSEITSRARTLFQMDLSSLPWDMNVLEATFTFTVSADLADAGCSLQMFALLKDFDEKPSVEGATWNNSTFFVPWQTPGAEGVEDITEQIGEGVILDGSLEVGDTVEIELTDPSFIEEIRRDNYSGFMIRCEQELNNMYQFYSADTAPTEETRPKLTVTYLPDGNGLDRTAWICVDVEEAGFYTDCSAAPLSQFPNYTYESASSSGSLVDLSGRTVHTVLMQCDPYPRCLNDYDVHYNIRWRLEWEGEDSTMQPQFFFGIPGGEPIEGYAAWYRAIDLEIEEGNECEDNVDQGTCEGFFDGAIPSELFPRWYEHEFSISLGFEADSMSTLILGWELTYDVWFSLEPIDQDCADTWLTPVIDSYNIDPAIETPLGPSGIPPDDQIYTTVPNEVYMVYVQGTWYDGDWLNDENAGPRNDAEVSFDGVTWYTWGAFQTYFAECVDTDPTRAIDPDYRIIYFTAQSETFYIRADEPDNEGWEDNVTNIPIDLDPFRYTIGLSFEVTEDVNCEGQFDYGEGDVIASVQVYSEYDDVATQPTTDFIPGDWYAIKVENGTWNEPSGPPRVDMEFFFDGVMDWEDLDETADLVYCVSEDGLTVFIQAPNGDPPDLHLRVNNSDDTFANNTGTLGVNIYHAAFNRTPTGCELEYLIDDFVSSDTVEGTAQNGKIWATSLSGPITFSYGLEPGGWYMLETTGGPWFTTWGGGDYDAAKQYYEMQVKSGEAGEWGPLEDFPFANCVVEYDAVGHERMYFQAPVTGGNAYYIRIAGASPVTRGTMGWNLYQAQNLGIGGGDCEDFVFDPNANLYGVEAVDADSEDGKYLSGLDSFSADFYAVWVHASWTETDPPAYLKSGWYESSSTMEEQDDLQFSLDDGQTWEPLPDANGVLCYYNTPGTGDLVFFFRYTQGAYPKLRVNSETFSDNVGQELFTAHLASTEDVWANCWSLYEKSVPELNPHEWISVVDEEGQNIIPELVYTEFFDDDGDGIIYWNNPRLAAGHTYAITTTQGPWQDGETMDSLYDAELSSDDGATWYPFADHPSVLCSDDEQNGKYWTAVFDVAEGEIWKVRVGDTETDVFTDNTGNLAYVLYLVNEFIDDPGDIIDDDLGGGDFGGFDACNTMLVRPASLTLADLIDIGAVGEYIVGWVQYFNRSVVSYFAWCPRHSELLISALRLLQTKEPVAMVEELATVSQNVIGEVESYNWDNSSPETFTLLTTNTARQQNAPRNLAVEIFDRMFPSQTNGPWDGGDLIEFGGPYIPPYYSSCNNVTADYFPTALRNAICFASAWWRETETYIWIQLSLDISALIAFFALVKSSVQSLVYMMTGVRPWTKDGTLRGLDKLAGHFERLEQSQERATRRYR